MRRRCVLGGTDPTQFADFGTLGFYDVVDEHTHERQTSEVGASVTQVVSAI